MINSKFNVYRTAQPNHSADRYSTTVLVDFAMQILQMQQEKSVDPLVTSMKQLNLEVEEALRRNKGLEAFCDTLPSPLQQ